MCLLFDGKYLQKCEGCLGSELICSGKNEEFITELSVLCKIERIHPIGD